MQPHHAVLTVIEACKKLIDLIIQMTRNIVSTAPEADHHKIHLVIPIQKNIVTAVIVVIIDPNIESMKALRAKETIPSAPLVDVTAEMVQMVSVKEQRSKLDSGVATNGSRE